MDGQFIIPAPRDSEFVELARGKSYRGKHFRKHLLNLGELIHPKTGEKLRLDEKWADQLEHNFDQGVCDIVQVPLANDKNEHTEDPLRNAGEVMGISREGSKVYVDLDIRDPKVQQGLKNKTILGASAYLNMDYTDTRTGEKVGPALLHSCITNRPYVLGLDDYEEVVAATADTPGDVIVLAQEEPHMTKDEMLAALKAEHGIDVEALQTAATSAGSVSELTAALTEALKTAPTAQLEMTAGGGQEGSLTGEDIVNSVVELANKNQALSDTVVGLVRKDAEREVDGYISEGKVLPKQRAGFIRLALEDRDQLMVMLPDKPVVAVSSMVGLAAPDGEQNQVADIDETVAALVKQHKEFFEKSDQNGRRR